MTSHHVTCHVTSLSRAFFIVLKKKNKNKNKIKRKIDKRKNKMLGPKRSITLSHTLRRNNLRLQS